MRKKKAEKWKSERKRWMKIVFSDRQREIACVTYDKHFWTESVGVIWLSTTLCAVVSNFVKTSSCFVFYFSFLYYAVARCGLYLLHDGDGVCTNYTKNNATVCVPHRSLSNVFEWFVVCHISSISFCSLVRSALVRCLDVWILYGKGNTSL